MDRIASYFIFLLMVLLSQSRIVAQSDSDSTDLYELSLTDLTRIRITTATKGPLRVLDIPATIFVITPSDIRDRGYGTLEDVLSDLPGFQFRNIQGFNSYVFQRGIPNQNNLILLLIDGVQVNELNSGGFYGGGQYNLSNVERIEVIYGPASVAYGTNAISGIINIITKQPTQSDAEFNLSGGMFNTSALDVHYSRPQNDSSIGVIVSGMMKRTDKGDLRGSAGDHQWTTTIDNFEKDYAADVKMQFHNVTLGSNILYKQSSTATSTTSTGTIYKDYGSEWNILFANSYLKYHLRYDERLQITSTLYRRTATVLDNTIYVVVDTAQVGYYRPNNLTGFESVVNFQSNNAIDITGGISLEFEQLSKSPSLTYSNGPNEPPPTPVTPEQVENNLISLFIEPRVAVTPQMSISGGVRVDKSSVYHIVWTPRVGLVQAFNTVHLRCSFAEAFRAPKPWDYSDGIGNSLLLPERMRSIETGIAWMPGDHLQIDLVGYQNRLTNAITRETVGPSFRWVNAGEINTVGGEVAWKYHLNAVQWNAYYTFTNSTDSRGQRVPEISAHTGGASATYVITPWLRWNARGIYSGKRYNPKIITSTGTTVIEPSLVIHTAVSFGEQDGFSGRVVINNVFNERYFHPSNRDPDRYRQPERSIIVTFGYRVI